MNPYRVGAITQEDIDALANHVEVANRLVATFRRQSSELRADLRRADQHLWNVVVISAAVCITFVIVVFACGLLRASANQNVINNATTRVQAAEARAEAAESRELESLRRSAGLTSIGPCRGVWVSTPTPDQVLATVRRWARESR